MQSGSEDRAAPQAPDAEDARRNAPPAWPERARIGEPEATRPATAVAPGWAARERAEAFAGEDAARPRRAPRPAETPRPGWTLWVMGLAAIVAGLIGLAMPLVSSLAAAVIVAACLMASGAVGLATAWRRRAEGGALAAGIALSLVSLLGGAAMLLAPALGLVTLTALIIAFFAVSGALKLWYALRMEPARGRGWMLAAGTLSVLLALFVWSGLPEAALILPGLLLALEMIATGALLIAMAIWGARRAPATA